MSTGREIDLIVFDLGRVLIRICDGWHHACDVAGVKPQHRELTPVAQAALHELVCGSEVGQIALDEFARAASVHLGITPAEVIAISNAHLRGVYPGATELLADLRSAGLTVACLSNTNANHWRLMTDPASGSFLSLDQFDHCFASHLVRMRKPEDRIYAHVERACGVAGERIMFFDDLEENIAAAQQRNWNAHRIRTDADPIAQARQHLRARSLIR